MAVTKMIEICGIPCVFKSSAAVPRMYRFKFRRDIFVDFKRISDSMDKRKQGEEADEDVESLPPEVLELFENIAYIMHKHGDPKQPSDIDEWLEQFDVFDIFTILPEILALWNLNTEQMSKAKKSAGT